ncbi:type VI secretion system Vgr family protein [Sphingobacterium sp. Mn56C]|uniref:type VI secretion system Vgr family protein n=1 Tax=Sphingobacterium sp. Mn56C TaxID=3395261 RepID=UPI003BC038FB
MAKKDSGGQGQKSNASLMAKNEISGISHLVKITIVVEGKQLLYYKNFHLKQTVSGHHQFTLILDHDALDGPEDQHLKNAQKLLGKRILVTFKLKNIINGPEKEFVGVITQVGLCRENRNHGNIVLSGFSPTILLDAAIHTQSFAGNTIISINNIVRTVIEQGLETDKYPVEINSTYENVAYSCQYQETHYNYLVRLAESYGQQFYYDGTCIRFGKLSFSEKPIPLTYGKNVDKIDINIRAVHLNYRYYGYNSYENQRLFTGPSTINHVSSLGKAASDISKRIFSTPSLVVAPLRARTTKDLDAKQEGKTGGASVNSFVTTGRTRIPFLYPGCLVDMDMLHAETNEPTYFTRLMITAVNHTVDKLGNYIGDFEAVGADTGYLPQKKFFVPIAEPQFATVINNADERGRVQVRFDWQGDADCSDWIRVLSPNAGSSQKVDKNRGFVFVPEIGDQVMVGFVHCHPDRPYVMGGLFHGGIGLGGDKQNHLKTIITRSGCSIQIDDDENQGSITIKDPSGNVWYMDGNKNISLSAPENFTINAGKNVTIHAGENMNLTVGNNMDTQIGNGNTVTVTKDHRFISDSYHQNIKGDKIIRVAGNLDEVTSTTTHKAKDGDVLIQSAGVAQVVGKIDAKINKE